MLIHKLSHCYRCARPLSYVRPTAEYIIPRDLAGTRCSRHLLCGPCRRFLNRSFGRVFLSAIGGLAHQLRHCPYRPGKNVVWNDAHFTDFEPQITQAFTPTSVQLSVLARGQKQLLTTLLSLRRSFPHLQPDRCVQQATPIYDYLPAPVPMPHIRNLPAVLRGATRIAINHYLAAGGNPAFLTAAIRFLDYRVEMPSPAAFYYPHNTSTQPALQNAIHLVGNPSTGVLYAYVSIFSTFNFLVLLSSTYTGPEIATLYTHNFLSNRPRPQLLRSAFLLSPAAIRQALAASHINPVQRWEPLFHHAQSLLITRLDTWYRMAAFNYILHSTGPADPGEEHYHLTPRHPIAQQLLRLTSPLYHWQGEIPLPSDMIIKGKG